MELPAVIAIHGVGNHPPGVIKTALEDEFRRAKLSPEIVEFNWNSYVDHSLRRMSGAGALLSTTAQSICQAAALPSKPSGRMPDRVLYQVEESIYHGVFRCLVAVSWTILILAPLAYLLAAVPTLPFASFSFRPLAWLRTGARWALIATLAVTLALLCVALVRSLASLSAKPLRVGVRRVVLLLLQPVLLLVTVPFSAELGSMVLNLILGMLPLALVTLLLALVLSPLNEGPMAALRDLRGYSFWVWALVLATLHVVLRQLWVGGVLKVVLDIVRYIGSPEYRQTLQNEFDKTLARLRAAPGGRSVMLCAHSLGSVIALDSLVNSQAWRPDDTVYLVTLGSPVRRFFQRFFPGYLFPSSVEQAAAAAARRVRALSWINIHRRWDYVGGDLGLGRCAAGTDICTGQAGRILSSHTNYWHDDVVLRSLMNGLGSTVPAPAALTAGVSSCLPEACDNGLQELLASGAKRLAFGLASILLLVGSINFFQSHRRWVVSSGEELDRVLRGGAETLAAVTYYRTVEGGGEDSYEVHHFSFQWPVASGEQFNIPVSDDEMFDRNARRFDYDGLAEYVLQGCTRTEEKRWWQILRRTSSIPCTLRGVPIRFDAASPSSFVVPGFPPRTGIASSVGEWLGYAFLSVFFVIACFALLGVGVLLFRLFLGLEARFS